MTNHPIDSALADSERTFEIDLLNKVTGTNYPKASVYGTNTLGQVAQEYGTDIGINPDDSKILFENKRTGASTSDMGETIAGLGLQAGDVLAISDNAGVAAVDFEAAKLNGCPEPPFSIDLCNKVTGTNYPKASVYGTNTLGQVAREYGADIGINPDDSKILFENKRTGASTSDMGETIAGLGLQAGDVLAISDNAGVAAVDFEAAKLNGCPEPPFSIDLRNKVTGTNYPKVSVYGMNTLGQVVQEYGTDIGIDPNNRKNLFENERTGASTSDMGETIAGLGLQEGDILVICDNRAVA